MKLYTIGYQQRSQEELLDVLEKNDIRALVDTRDNPNSRKPGFSKGVLALACAARGVTIRYAHFPELGIPKKDRDKIKEHGDVDKFWLDYINKLSRLENLIVEDLVEAIKSHSVCLLCYEREPECCHRKVLAEYLEGMIPELKVVHL